MAVPCGRLSTLLKLYSGRVRVTKLALPRIWSQRYCHGGTDKQDDVKGLVYISTSPDVFSNLAFEDWVYNNLDLSDTNLMMLWRNEPCVVIGRHQNPWAECNLRQVWGSDVRLARRRSGGGTVYHDLGNLNITFFTTRGRYNRPKNLKLISAAIRTRWPHLSVSVTDRDDMVIDDFFKISGTSSKLGRKVAYHHCTLLHSVNTNKLKGLLHVNKEGLTTKATTSVHSAVKNLTDIEPTICHKSLIQCINTEYYNQFTPYRENQAYEVDPTADTMWYGIAKLRSELKSWQWIYGKTPRFSVREQRGAITVQVHVHNATIEGAVIQAPAGWMDVGHVQYFTDYMKGHRFWPPHLATVSSTLLESCEADSDTLKKYRLLASMIQGAAS